MAKLIRKDIINKIAEKTGFKKQDIKRMFEVFEEIVCREITKGNTILFRKLFTIMPTVRTGNKYNINTEQVEYKEEYVSVKITPSTYLKRIVREKSQMTKKDRQRSIEKQMAALQERLKRLDEDSTE